MFEQNALYPLLKYRSQRAQLQLFYTATGAQAHWQQMLKLETGSLMLNPSCLKLLVSSKCFPEGITTTVLAPDKRPNILEEPRHQHLHLPEPAGELGVDVCLISDFDRILGCGLPGWLTTQSLRKGRAVRRRSSACGCWGTAAGWPEHSRTGTGPLCPAQSPIA